jgi:hypothetical protein
MAISEDNIFDGKSFSDILSDIYTASKRKERQITKLISELQPMIKNIGDATILVPLIAEYMDISVKNDEQLVKMAAIVQRAVARNSTTESTGELLTEDEKKQLILAAQEIEDKDGLQSS